MKLPDRATDIKVGGKTHNEIKQRLEYCHSAKPCIDCKYDRRDFPHCVRRLLADAINGYEQLESRLAEVERERDAAVADLESVDEKYETLKSMIDDVTFNHEPYGLYLDFRAAADAIVEHEHADVWRERECLTRSSGK